MSKDPFAAFLDAPQSEPTKKVGKGKDPFAAFLDAPIDRRGQRSEEDNAEAPPTPTGGGYQGRSAPVDAPDAMQPLKEEPGKLEALGRGIKQGASLGFGDELTGLVESIFTEKSYQQARDEARANDAAAKKAHGGYYMGGEIGGGLATALIPGLGIAKGASVAATAGKAALAGGLGGIGGSEHDLTKGDVGGVVKDAAVGGVVGGVVGGALAKVSNVAGKFLGNAEKRVEGRLIEDVGNKALPSTRTRIGEMAPDVIEALKSTELDKVVRNPKLLKTMTAEQRQIITSKTNDLWQAVDQHLGGQDVKPVLKALQVEQIRLAKNPAEAARASKLGDIIERLEDRHLQPDQLDQTSLLRRMTQGASQRSKEKVGARADDVAEVLQHHGLTNSIKNPKDFAAKVSDALDKDGKEISQLWDIVSGDGSLSPSQIVKAKKAGYTTIGDIIAPVQRLQKSVSDNPNKKGQVAALEGLIGRVRSTWGKAVDGATESVDDQIVPLRKVREFVTDLQNEALESGSFIDPLAAKKFSRKVANSIKDVMDTHLETHAPEEAAKLQVVNKRFSILKDLDSVAKKRAVNSEMQGATTTGNGRISSTDLRELIATIGPEPHIKPTQKNVFERRVAGILEDVLDGYGKRGAKVVPGAAELPQLQKFSKALDQVQAAADRRANLAQFPPTGIREIGVKGGHGGVYGEAKRAVLGGVDEGLRKVDPAAAAIAKRLQAIKAERLRQMNRQLPVSVGAGLGQATSSTEPKE